MKNRWRALPRLLRDHWRVLARLLTTLPFSLALPGFVGVSVGSLLSIALGSPPMLAPLLVYVALWIGIALGFWFGVGVAARQRDPATLYQVSIDLDALSEGKPMEDVVTVKVKDPGVEGPVQ